MTLSEFRKIPFVKKGEVITTLSHYLAARPFTGQGTVFLYHHNNFFIEVFFEKKKQKVMFINAFQGMRGLEPYLETISIDELTQLI